MNNLTYLRDASTGRFQALAEESRKSLERLPSEERPELFSGSDPLVIEWLATQERSAALGAAVSFANTTRERVAKATHYLQTSRWPVQLAAAQDVLAQGEQAQPLHLQMIDLEARLRARGETREQLAQKVIANSGVFTLVGAAVDGIETATLDALRAYAGSDTAALAAIVAQARLDLQVELIAIFTPALGEPQALALVAQILGE